MPVPASIKKDSGEGGCNILFLVYNVKTKQKPLLGIKEPLRSAVAYLRRAELCPQPQGLPGQLQAWHVLARQQ